VAEEDAAQLRREFRAWVREHHPDAGGDLDEFAAGMRRWHEVLGSDSAEDGAKGMFGAVRRWRRRGSERD
jgi:hypothetical protein